MTQPGIEVKSQLVLGLRLYFTFLPQLQDIIPSPVKEIAVGAVKFHRILAKFEDLCLVHIFQQFLRCFTEPVDLLRLTHIFKKLFFVLRSTWQLYVVFVNPAVELLRGVCLIWFTESSVHRFVRICSEHNTWSCAFSLFKLFFSFHAYRLLNDLCRQCVIEDDRIGPCLVKFQSSFLSEQYIAPIYCVLKWFPSIFVRRDSCF